MTDNSELKPVLTVNKWKFMLWLFIITIVMLFASLTSAYLVKRSDGNWNDFEIPTIFYFSTGVLLISSLFMQLAYRAAKKDNFAALKIYILACFGFGVLFLTMQYLGWQELQTAGLYLKGNVHQSFYYVLTGVHFFHLISGLFVLAYSFYSAMTQKIHSKNMIHIEVSATYWHFLDVLWIYLFVFLIFFK
ncbi:MAG: cytochrome c oxidase subunit 3 [Leadbetterella sp.]